MKRQLRNFALFQAIAIIIFTFFTFSCGSMVEVTGRRDVYTDNEKACTNLQDCAACENWCIEQPEQYYRFAARMREINVDYCRF